jgi:glycine/D-amino acid oxidase-like deaminating enzyme/nitrite reductase/ring-hydroxylating ferredoxin subunit
MEPSQNYLSYWVHSTPPRDLPSAELPGETDVVVVGGGIAGVTTAYLLTQAGKQVVLLEADRLGLGTTGGTTAKVSAQHGMKYYQLALNRGKEAAEAYAASNSAALEWIADESTQVGSNCDFERRDCYIFTRDSEQRDEIALEVAEAVQAGLPMELVEGDIGLPFDVAAAAKLPDQAQFDPRRWLLALAERAVSQGCVIVEHSRVSGVRGTSSPFTVKTPQGDVRAPDVVIATHYPILDRGLFFARLDPIHDLVAAAEIAEQLPGMYKGLDTGHSVRTVPTADGRQLLIALGEHHRTGEAGDASERYQRLARWAQAEFDIKEPAYRWSAHDLNTPDGMPYIGRYHPMARGLWVATGFGQWGMTGGTLAGLLLSDLITGIGNPWAELYDPSRVPALKSVSRVAKSNLQVAKHLVGDHARALSGTDPRDLKPGEATVSVRGVRPVAAYRDADDTLHAVSARCTHLGCLVQFNNAEHTWDCPCHASRFELDGAVLHGPAVDPLEPVQVDQDGDRPG